MFLVFNVNLFDFSTGIGDLTLLMLVTRGQTDCSVIG